MSQPPVRLLISPVIEQAQAIATRVTTELPGHEGLARATALVVEAAKKASQTAQSMKRPFSPHRLPVMFLAAALLGLGLFVYWQFFYVTTLSLALPDRDAVAIRARVTHDARVNMTIADVAGSREAAALLAQGKVDLGFIQGGVPVPSRLLRLETPGRELVLYFVRANATGPVTKVLTSVQGEGSHSVAQAFFAAWKQPVEFVHTWQALTQDAAYQVPAEIEAAFVVKDPADDLTVVGAERLVAQGFTLVSAKLGARAAQLDYLDAVTLPTGHLREAGPIPSQPIETYSVSTWLVAREGLTPRLLTQAAAIIQERPTTITERSFQLSSHDASELFQGIDSFLSVLVHIAVAFLALLGLDIVVYRRHLHELNSLVSLVSMLQSNKDVLGVPQPARAENQLYLSLCSDLLGLISAVSGYYTQENSTLLFNNLSEVVHQRCDSLKINIQLKLLHSIIPFGQ
jgi:hypothetical protein